MKNVLIILVVLISSATFAQSTDWVASEATDDFYLSFGLVEDNFMVHFDIPSAIQVDQFSDIELGFTSGEFLPYHFNANQVVFLSYEALSLPLPTSNYLDIMSNGAISYLKINSVMYPLSDKDRGQIVKTVKGGF